jgi:hypothetical protein
MALPCNGEKIISKFITFFLLYFFVFLSISIHIFSTLIQIICCVIVLHKKKDLLVWSVILIKPREKMQ